MSIRWPLLFLIISRDEPQLSLKVTIFRINMQILEVIDYGIECKIYEGKLKQKQA